MSSKTAGLWQGGWQLRPAARPTSRQSTLQPCPAQDLGSDRQRQDRISFTSFALAFAATLTKERIFFFFFLVVEQTLLNADD